MSKYLDKFKATIEKKGYNAPGIRNNSIPAVVKFAKFYEVDQYDFYAYMKNEFFGRDYTPSDEASIKRAWSKVETDATYEDYMNAKSESEDAKKNDDITKDISFNKKFLAYIRSCESRRMTFEERDTSMLRWFFKKDDLIHIVDNRMDECLEASDCLTLMEKEMPMKKFQLMSLATFRDADGRRRNANVKENRYVLLECDKLSLDLQEKFFFSLIEYGLPVKSIIYSGGKSFHCLLKVHPMRLVDEYKEYCENIHREFNKLFSSLVDANNKDGVRYSRSPFGYRSDKGKSQDMIWCDCINADDEKYEFKDTLEQVKDYVSLFESKAFNTGEMKHPPIKDANGKIHYHLLDSLNSNGYVEDIFKSSAKYWLKLKGHELQNFSRDDIWDTVNQYIDKDIINVLLEGKDDKHKRVSMSDFYVCVKDIKFEVTLKENDNFYNMFEPGYITECMNRKVTTMPSEFDKLLHNIADDRCRDWLINHLACHFWLITNDFKRDGKDFVLETVPVFYGMSGTGKNTFLDIIGQAISKNGTRYISIGNIGDDFNEYYMAGAINVNEAAKGKAERRASKEALKKFTDLYQNINMKFMPKIRALNTAYKSISANESIYGVLDIDEFDRRFQYITGGEQLNAQIHKVCDMHLLNSQKYDFIAYLLNYQCDWDKAVTVFDNAAKEEDKLQSMSIVEQVAHWIWENISSYPCEVFSVKTIIAWYSEQHNGKVPDVSYRIVGKALTKFFGEAKQAGKDLGFGSYMVHRGEMAYNVQREKEEVDKLVSIFKE